MRIREAIVRNYNDLPGYKLIGYSEVAIPMYQRKVHVLALTKKSIPVVEEFVLNFYNEGLSLDDIKLVLGLEQQLIDEAMAGLIQRDYINNFTKEITDIGQDYLKNNNVESLEKEEFSIIIDGLTGEIKKNNNNLMVTKNIKNKGIRALRANIDKPTIGDLDFKSLRRVFNQYKESESVNENENEAYSGNMIDVVHMEGNTTKYRRIELLIFKNDENDVRVIAFDGFNRVEEYEEKLKELDSRGVTLLKYDYDEYFESGNVKNINEIVNSEDDVNNIEYEKVNLLYETYLEQCSGTILITLPLISQCSITEAFVDKIESKLKKGLSINIILCGKDYKGEFQKKIYRKIKDVSSKYQTLTIKQTPHYFNKMIINLDNKESIVSIYEKNNISLTSTKEGIAEYFYEVKSNSCELIYNTILDDNKEREKIKFDLSNINKQVLRKMIDDILYLVKDADGYMYSNDDIGWIGSDEVPEINRFKEVPLANDEEKFRTFIDSINKSLVESLEINANQKGYKKYFWNDFEHRYTELQSILNKIKTYRNKSNHLELNEFNKQKYYKFLNEDMGGYMPEFIYKGYLILQFKILNELETVIKNTISALK
jgi:hypothetical protein